MIIDTEILLQEADEQSRNQGQRPTCLAFAISNLNRGSAPGILSPEYLYRSAAQQISGWVPGNGLELSTTLAVASSGQPEEHQYPYQAEEPPVPIPSLPIGLALYGNLLHIYPRDVCRILDTIRAGVPIGLILRMTPEFFTPANGIVAFSAGVLPGMQHAVVAVGIGIEPSTSSIYVLIQNSWGPTWGINGYAWVPHNYLTLHTSCSFGI